MIWDRLFGTFKAEEDKEKIHYGITTQFNSWNPAWANVHYYIELFEKARNMKWFDKLKVVFAKPGWLPEYLGGQQQVKAVDEGTYKKYDSSTNIYFRIYAAVQFCVLLWATVQYMSHYSTISMFYKTVFFLLMLITMLIIGAIFENKRWIVVAEYARLVLVMLSLNTFYYFWYINWFNVTMIVSAALFVGCVAFFTYSYIVTRKQTQAVVAE
jgi:hypothetical protein